MSPTTQVRKNTEGKAPSAPAAAPADPAEALIELVERFTAGGDGQHAMAVPGLYFIRMSAPLAQIHTVQEPALCVVLQGRKQTTLRDERYAYDARKYLVASQALPLMGKVTQASKEKPYLCIRLDFKPREITDLLSREAQLQPANEPPSRGLFVGTLYPALLDALLRIVRLLETPNEIPMLAPLYLREIIYRLLKDEAGAALRALVGQESPARKVAAVIDTLRRDFHKPLRIDELAAKANMSRSSLHEHFKAVTNMSPLQFQKQLRLQEARLLMLSEAADAATAGHRVGYESPSQFSREYSRMFGEPPLRDIARLRKDAFMSQVVQGARAVAY